MATETLRPNAAGDSTQFTPYPGEGEENWEDVDEEVSDGGSTEVRAAIGNKKDFYNIADPSFPDGATINKVTLYAQCSRYSSTNYAGYYGIKSGATESLGSSVNFPSTYTGYSREYATDPNTGEAWTKAAITSLQIGVKSAATASGGMRCTQIYVEVDYSAIVAKPRSYGYIIG